MEKNISLDYGYELIRNTKTKALFIAGGIKATDNPKNIRKI